MTGTMPSPSPADVVAAATEVAMKAAGVEAVRKVFKRFGTARISELDPKNHAAVIDALRALPPSTNGNGTTHNEQLKVALQARLSTVQQRTDAATFKAAFKRELAVLLVPDLEHLQTLCAALVRDLEAELLPPEVAAALPPFSFNGCPQSRILARATPALIERIRKNAPPELLALPNWVGCDRSPKTDEKTGALKFEKDGTLKSSKKPLSPHNGKNAKVNDASTWGTFDQACAFALRDPRVATVGVNLVGTDYVGLDWDDVIDEHGDVLPHVQKGLDALPRTCIERSPSTKGLRLFFRGQKPEWMSGSQWKLPDGGELEIYDKARGRYLTVTGDILGQQALPIHELRDGDLDALRGICDPSVSPSKTPTTTGAPTGDLELDKVRAALEVIDPDLYEVWFRCGLALYAFGDAGRQVWDEWSRRSDKFDQGTSDEKWASFAKLPKGEKKRPGVGTIYYYADRADKTWRQRWQGANRVKLGQRDPATNKLVLCPRRTVFTAEAFVREHHLHQDIRTLHCYAGQLLQWQPDQNCYRPIEDAQLRHQLQPLLHDALRYTSDGQLIPFEANPQTVRDAATSIQTLVHLPASTPAPCWLDNKPDRPPVNELLVGKTKTLHIPTGSVLLGTPLLFTTAALDFDYEPEAPAPLEWQMFLQSILGADKEAHDLLQEFFGYCLTGDTSLQKALLIVGPRRSGKGTLARVLSKLIGIANTVGPTTSALASQFGLQPLIGKSLAIVSDARFTGENIPIVVERLLCITGEDALTIDRKFMEAVTMKLPTRFMFLTNELPMFGDASGALAGRFLVLTLTKSFYGQEDPALTHKLLEELPGILPWALEGWRRLHERGRFVEPESSRAAVQDLADLSSPVSAFVREHCEVGPGHRVKAADLFTAWRGWCLENGRTFMSTSARFGRDLATVLPGIRVRQGTGGHRFYEAIRLRQGADDSKVYSGVVLDAKEVS